MGRISLKLIPLVFQTKTFVFGVLFLYSSVVPSILYAIWGAEGSGFKYYRNYSPREYDRAPQNWAIIQDKEGRIYVANQGDVLEYDGVSWRTIETKNRTSRSIAIDSKGTIYIGDKNGIGYLASDSKGTLHYVSLLDYLEDNQKNFSNVWETHAANDGIFFHTSKYLFRWDAEKEKMEHWKPVPERRFNASFTCNGKFFLHQRQVGLMHIVNNSLDLVPGDQTFANVKIFMMVPFDDYRILIGTRNNGFFLYDGKKSDTFSTEADQYLKEKKICHGIRLSMSPNRFAVATREGGIVIIDSRGRLKQVFNKAWGIRNDDVKSIFEDSSGNLWLALNDGITKIEYASPISHYDQQSGLPRMVLSITRHGDNNRLFAGTNNGLWTLEPDGQFRRVPGLSGLCFSLLSTEHSLLAATTYGVVQVKANGNESIRDNATYVLYRSRVDANRIWTGTSEGLISLYLDSADKNKNGKWKEEHHIEEIPEEIRSIAEDQMGNLWLGTQTKGVIKVNFPVGNSIDNPIVKRYGMSHGLPRSSVSVSVAAGHIIFATTMGIFRFDEKKKVFLPDYTLGAEFAGGETGKDVFRMVEDSEKNIWFHSDLKNFLAISTKPDGAVILNRKVFRRIPKAQINCIYLDPDGNIIWFAGNDGLIRFDKRIKKNYNLDFKTIIRKVWVNGILIFDGYRPGITNDSKPRPTTIEYKDRNIRINFAAPFFENELATTYQYRLDGYDEDWSPWTLDTQKDYTNLDAGHYTFRVQAKNVYGTLSSEAVFQFKVLPPWYQTWWAYLLYAFAAFFTLFLLFKWRSRKLVLEKERLERIVHQRTQEIEDKNQQLEEQSEKLKEMDKIKSRFFANISHEFRTPITLLMGPLEQMIADCSENETGRKRKLTMMMRNAQRLLRLINQLLELSKLDSGKMKLQAVKTDVVSFVKGIADSFRFLVQQKEMDLVFKIEQEEDTKEEGISLYIDPRKMEDIMSNLLINAVKFTPAGGEIRLTVKGSKEFVEISVSDTGPGISAEQLAHVFDRFYQADATYEHYQKGSGIGLALSKELVELHHGTIEARSKEGEGTTFIVRLPIGKDHLAGDEMVKPDAPVDIKSDAAPSKISEEIPASDLVVEEEEKEPETGMDEKDIILVVEDSTDMRDYIKEALEPYYAVAEAEDGREGIEKAQEIIPDLIISDIMMPGADGYELCRELKNNVKTSHIPIILLTAKASEDNIVEGLETGADDYITKPFSTKILSARIKNLIDIRRQLQINVNREMTLQPVRTSISNIDKEFLHDLHVVINKNLADPEFNVEDLCRRLYMSRTTLYRKVQALSGLTPTDFIRTYRLKRGAELLKQSTMTVLEVAFEVGFSNSSYFAKCFKEKFHQLPSEYQDANKQ